MTKKRVWSIVGIVFGVLIIGVAIFGIRTYLNAKNAAKIVYQSAGIQKQRNTSSILKDGKPVSILLLGTDTGALGRNYKGRTDTSIIATVNKQKKTLTLVSIPRDSEIAVNGFKQDFPTKINAAYAYGSAATTISTMQDWLKIPIDFYALINMGGMKKVVNQMGGVDITPIRSFNFLGYKYVKGQKTHMDGDKALQYSRMRYDDPLGDYGRQARQRQLIEAILKKSSSADNILKQDFLSSLAAQTRTDLTFDDLITLSTKYRDARDNTVSDHAQGTGKMIDGQSFEVISVKEKQRVTDVIRNSLDLGHKDTGSQFNQ